jgi:hypothetical protein
VHYRSYPRSIPLRLTLSFSAKFNTNYTIDFERMVQVNDSTGVVRPLCIMPVSYHSIRPAPSSLSNVSSSKTQLKCSDKVAAKPGPYCDHAEIQQILSYEFGCFIDGVGWVPYIKEDNESMDRHYRSSPSLPLHFTPSFSGLPNNKYTIDFERMIQVNSASGVVRPIRIMPPITIKPDSTKAAHIETYTPEARRERIRQLTNDYCLDRDNAGLLFEISIFAWDFEDPVHIDQSLSMTGKEICIALIRLEPNRARHYARAAQSLEKDESLTLHDGRVLSKAALLDRAITLDSRDPIALLNLAWAQKDLNAKSRLEFESFNAFGGSTIFHSLLNFACSGGSSKVQTENATRAINLLLDTVGDEIQGDVHEDSIMVFRICGTVSLRGNYTKILRESVIDLLFALAAAMGDQRVSIQGVSLDKSGVKQLAATKFGKKALGHRIYQVKGVDAGRKAWYYVLVTGSVRHFLKCLDDDIIHLEHHGQVLFSAYGDEAPDATKKKVMAEYGIDEDGPVFESVHHLSLFLRTVPDVPAAAAMHKLRSADLKALDNPFLVQPEVSQIEAMLQAARGRALSTSVPGWPDGDTEPYVSWKIAISVYTMERPYQLYRLINAPLHTQSRSVRRMDCHLHFLRLLQRALGSWPAQLRFRGTLYRGMQIGERAALRDLVQRPEALLQPGTRLTFAAPTSASKQRQIAEGFCGGLLYELEGAEGCDIQRLSFLPREQEVLLPPPFIVQVSRTYSLPDGRGLVVVGRTCPDETKYL